MLTRQFSPKVAHKGRDKEKITAIYCLWMIDNKREGERVIAKKENFKGRFPLFAETTRSELASTR